MRTDPRKHVFRRCNSKDITLPETKSSHLKMVVSNRNLLLKGSIFRGYVSFREGISLTCFSWVRQPPLIRRKKQPHDRKTKSIAVLQKVVPNVSLH